MSCVFLFSFLFLSDVIQLKSELNSLVDAIIENFFQPEKNDLIARSESE